MMIYAKLYLMTQ